MPDLGAPRTSRFSRLVLLAEHGLRGVVDLGIVARAITVWK
jgi:hypothetical protein